MKLTALFIVLTFCSSAFPSVWKKTDPTIGMTWKDGTVDASSIRREDLGAMASAMGLPNFGGPAMSTASVTRVHGSWQGFAISGNGYGYLVECRFGARRLFQDDTARPILTVHGPVRYAFEKGRFFLKDENGLVFEMFVIEKALMPAKAAPPEK